jgi:hypothetical protein
MSKTSILRSLKAGRITAGRDESGQWAIEPCELHRVYPPLDDTGTGKGTEERDVRVSETALAKASARATQAEAQLSNQIGRPVAVRRIAARVRRSAVRLPCRRGAQ